MWLCAYMWIFANMNMHLHMFACMNLPESQCCEGVKFRVSIEERMLIRQHWNSLLEILSFWWYHRNVLRLKSSWIRIIHFLKKFFSENVLFRKQHQNKSGNPANGSVGRDGRAWQYLKDLMRRTYLSRAVTVWTDMVGKDTWAYRDSE